MKKLDWYLLFGCYLIFCMIYFISENGENRNGFILSFTAFMLNQILLLPELGEIMNKIN